MSCYFRPTTLHQVLSQRDAFSLMVAMGLPDRASRRESLRARSKGTDAFFDAYRHHSTADQDAMFIAQELDGLCLIVNDRRDTFPGYEVVNHSLDPRAPSVMSPGTFIQ
nr:hypothetical protein [Pantoea sp. 201603H]